MGAIQRKSLDAPDEVRPFAHGVGHLARVGGLSIGRGILQPGWRWSIDVKPVANTDSCRVHHLQVLLAGRLRVQMDDGEVADFAPNDVFDIPPGHDAWVIGEDPVGILDVLGNLGQFGVPGEQDRMVTTILISDIVDSTAAANRLGDSDWKQVLADHNRVVRVEVDRYRGSEVKATGDGFLATFPGAAAAVRCAMAMRDAVRKLGVELRIGVHTGEVEVLPGDIGGVAVHAAARVMALAGPSEILVSSMTRGLAEGSGLRFEERGHHPVKGFDRPMEVFLASG